MTPQLPSAYQHVPELWGRLVPPEASGLRFSDDDLQQWDARAQLQGLPPDWRWPDAWVEQSRQQVLAPLGSGDLWVFAYGSLMWNPGLHFDEVRRARVAGYERRFALAIPIGRGTVEQPGLTLTLEPAAGHCDGLAFRVPAALVEHESRMLWRREMIQGGYCPAWLALHTPQGAVQGVVLTANACHPQHRSGWSLEQTARTIVQAHGSLGSNRDYLDQLLAQCSTLGISDGYLERLGTKVESVSG